MNIKLVKFKKKFITKTMIGWLNDKNLMRYSEQRYLKHTKVSCIKFYLDNLRNKNLYYAILDENRHVGNIRAVIDKFNSVADIGILIAYQDHGYGNIAWKKIMNILVKKGVRKITGGAMKANKAMIKIFLNNGMKLEYRKIKHFKLQCSYTDLVGYYYFS
jgi:RimJ/RimL family protein N-acetyltransferase